MSHALGGSVKLRKPCEHGVYDKHPLSISEDWGNDYSVNQTFRCPGGEFLPEDALVISRDADGEWPEWASKFMAGLNYEDHPDLWGKFALDDLKAAADQVGEPGNV